MLDLTPEKIMERKGITINPCKTCEPVGAMFCALGVHRCMPHSHGSQGCSSYHRTVLGRHYKETAIATTSSFTEGASVFGGRSNINTAVKNIFDIYDPDIIAIHTTCLSETIGDDLQSYILDMSIPEGKDVLYASTPSYEGSHIQGFSNMMCGFMNYLTEARAAKNGRTAIFPGWVDPGDDRELKRMARLMGVPFIYFPDHDDTMDVPMTGKYEYYGKGGTTREEIAQLGGCSSLIALGYIIGQEPAEYLQKKCKVPYTLLPLPVGVGLTDKYLMALQQISKNEVPYELESERGRLVDLLLDSNPYTNKKKVAIYGDPDVVYSMTSLCLEMDMIPKYVITGTPNHMGEWETLTKELIAGYCLDEECIVKADADLFYLHQLIKNEPVDLLLGGTYGKYIARAENIPLIRMGFPVLDRYGGVVQPVVGYAGAIRMVEKITNVLMDRQDQLCEEEDFECVM